MGSADLAVQHPLNDEQMRRNRRIVFKWSRCLLPAPIIHYPMPDIPKPTPPNPDDDPNVVYAGNRFMMKILSGVSAGEVLGLFSYQFLLVDVVNKRSCEYHYAGALGTVGVPPFTECGESDFSKEFSTKKFIQVDQFSGPGTKHISGSVGIMSGMRFEFVSSTDADLQISLSEMPITMFAGPSKSLGAEAGQGPITKIPGTVKVFKV